LRICDFPAISASDFALTDLPFIQSAENNKEPIARILRDVFRDVRNALEIGSGTAQHAVHFGKCLPHLTWQTSDLAENLDGIRRRLAAEATGNVLPPVALDVAHHPWPVGKFDAIFSANILHILSWPDVEHLFRGVGDHHLQGGLLSIYGPFKYRGTFTSESNARFDAWLKAQDAASGIRDFEAVDALARAQGLKLLDDYPMPANNQLLLWRRVSLAIDGEKAS